MVYPLDLYPAFFGYYFFNFMMAVLQSLHIFWAYLIIRMAQKFITGKARQGSGGGLQPSSCREVLLQGLDLRLSCAAWDEGNGVGLPRVKCGGWGLHYWIWTPTWEAERLPKSCYVLVGE